MAKLSNTVESIGDVALADSLINRTITELNDDVVETIKTNAFYGCNALTDVSFANVKTITNSSFNNCLGLKVADFHNLTSIGQAAFVGCNNLKSLIIRNPNVVAKLNFELGSCGIGKGGYIYVPNALLNNYKADNVWKKYSDYIRAIEDYPEVCSYLGRVYEEVTQVEFSDGTFSNPDWSRFSPDIFRCINNRLIACWGSSGVFSSEDGEIWTQSNCKFNGNEEINCIEYHNGLWVAGTSHYSRSYSRLIYSEDGITWTDSNIVGLSGNSFYDIAYSDDIWVACGYAGIYYSEDGKTWTKSDVGKSIEKVFYGNGVFVALHPYFSSDQSVVLYYSEDGKTWTSISGLSLGSGNGKQDLIYANGIFIAVGSYNNYQSTDGKTWSKITTIDTACYSVHYVNNKWFFSGGNGKIYCSDDLTTFVCSDSPDDKYKTIMDMTFANHVYIAAIGKSNDGINSSYKNGVFYSYDGINWRSTNRSRGGYSGYNITNTILCYYEKNHTIYLQGSNEFYRSRLWD
jgi:hypothetical protein